MRYTQPMQCVFHLRYGSSRPLMGCILILALVFALTCTGFAVTNVNSGQATTRSDHACCDPGSQSSPNDSGKSSCCVSTHHLPFDKAASVVMVSIDVSVMVQPMIENRIQY